MARSEPPAELSAAHTLKSVGVLPILGTMAKLVSSRPDAVDRRVVNRRASVRRPASRVPELKARVVAGREVRLINVAKRGVLFETEERLLPNTSIRIRFQGTGREIGRAHV